MSMEMRSMLFKQSKHSNTIKMIKTIWLNLLHGLWYYFWTSIIIYIIISLFLMPVIEKVMIETLIHSPFLIQQILGYFIRILLYYFILYMEFSCYVLISNFIYNNQKISITIVINELINQFPKAFNLSNWRLLLGYLIIYPLLGVPISSNILNSFEISDTIINFIRSSTILNNLYLTILIILSYLTIKWSYGLYYSIFEDVSLKNGVIERRPLTKKTLISHLIVFSIILISGQIINFGNALFAKDIILLNFFNDSRLTIIFHTLFMMLSGIVYIIAMPLYFTVLTYNYHNIDYFNKSNKWAINHGVNRFESIEYRLKNSIIKTVILAILSFIVMGVSFYYEDTINLNKSKIMVHRAGGNLYNENSLEAINAAIKNGFEAIEIDVMELKDGEIVLCHDVNLKRITGANVNIYELSLEELTKFSVLSNDKTKFITLNEALKTINGQLLVNIELKVHGFESQGYLSKVISTINMNKMNNKVMISSFNYETLKHIERLAPSIKTILISYFVPDLNGIITDGIAVDFSYLDIKKIEKIKESNKLLLIWTVNDETKLLEAISYNSDYIITDRPNLLRYILDLLTGL